MKFNPDDRLYLGFEPALKPFRGRLADPIVRRNDLELAFEKLGEEVQTIFEKESERISFERREKLELLLEHYMIPALSDAKRWRALAYALACDFVPGMQVLKRAPRKRGRPPIWKKSSIAGHLVEVVESIKLERKKGIPDAVRAPSSLAQRTVAYANLIAFEPMGDGQCHRVRASSVGHAR
jgi:hypothetical protein